jgi:hypothetical protein
LNPTVQYSKYSLYWLALRFFDSSETHSTNLQNSGSWTIRDIAPGRDQQICSHILYLRLPSISNSFKVGLTPPSLTSNSSLSSNKIYWSCCRNGAKAVEFFLISFTCFSLYQLLGHRLLQSLYLITSHSHKFYFKLKISQCVH